MIISLRQRNPHPNPVLLLNNIPLQQVQQERYLGMILTTNMSWKEHIHNLTSKATKKLGILFNMKDKLSRTAKSKYYISFIRPLLEYGGVVFDNCTAHESNSLELVQRRAAILCTGAFKRSPTHLLLSDVGWDSLSNRRKNAKVILMYKIVNGLTPPYLRELIPPQVQSTTPYPLRNRRNYRIPPTRTQLSHHSYIPASLRQWNELDPDLRNSRTLHSFKYKIKSKFKKHPLVKAYSTSFGPCSKYLTQIRLGLSKLKAHLFSFNIIPDPICPYCPNNVHETSCHYLLECPAFAAQREVMFRSLRELLPLTIINNNRKCLDAIIHGNQTSSTTTNIQIFRLVHKYIKETERFVQ